MYTKIKPKSIYELPTYIKIIAGVVIFILFTITFLFFPTASVDWHYTFYPVSQLPLHPYDIRTFVNLPWTAIILYPLNFFSENFGLAINASLNTMIIVLLIFKRKGSAVSLILTLTSFPFLSLLANGSIEWIPALGFLLQNGYGIPMILTKPQSGIFVVFTWFRSAKKKWLFFMPSILVIIVSFYAWGNWIGELISNVQYMSNLHIGLFTVSISPFPWGIPFGLALIYYILKYKPQHSELLGTLSTFFFVPYFVPHSLTILFALLAISYRRIAIASWVLLWLHPILIHWGTFIQILGFQH